MLMEDRGGSVTDAKDRFIGELDQQHMAERRSGLSAGLLKDTPSANLQIKVARVRQSFVGLSTTGFLSPPHRIKDRLRS